MKKYFIIFATLLVFCNLKAQPSSEVGKIALSVILPENVDGLDVSQLSKMESKITQIVTSTGLASSGYNNNFVIYPIFAIYETNVIEGGMQNITVVTCDLSIFIKQVDNNVVFSSISKQLKGSGQNKKTALTNAIAKISTNDIEFKTFIKNGKDKIIQYYESRCQDIILKSEGLVKMQDYEQALGLLMTVPEEVSCYNKVQQKSIEAYKAYQKQKCIVQLQEAKTEIASNNFSSALNILSQIDPSTPCFNESQSLVNNAESKIDVEEKKQWDMEMKVYDDDIALEKQRINAIKDIATAYYQSKPTTINYTFLVR